MKTHLRAGVIGTGAMGSNHARVYYESSKYDLIGVADVDSERANTIAQNYECKAFNQYETLLKEKLDVVSIVVPTILHKEVALSAVSLGSNILVEKPISDTIQNADEMIKAAHEKEVRVLVGHIERFNPAIIKLKELIDSNLLGEIISISAKRVGPFNPRIRDVGIILDLGTHDIDILSYLSGKKVKAVYAVAGSAIHTHEDHAIITLTFEGGSNGVIETNWLTPHKMRTLTVVGSNGIAEADYINSSLHLFDKEWIRDAKIEKHEPLKLEIEHFAECIIENKEPLITGEDGRTILGIALKAMESAQTGKVYPLS
ncbi:MAG: Gfo/Idh/MocA family oxidoreductase [Dehalococcoidales bacterium]|nr:Gfo/Idh/MocA family oxidoreductase [Dehalococcoidales bacterium]